MSKHKGSRVVIKCFCLNVIKCLSFVRCIDTVAENSKLTLLMYRSILQQYNKLLNKLLQSCLLEVRH